MKTHYHLVGIGGIGMSGIAQLILRKGEKVSGSDLKEGRSTQELKNLGARIFIGHAAGNIQGADTVVYSSAIKKDNPEIIEANNKGIPLLRRAEALALLMQDKTVITVTGSHGKTTTTSLVSYLLLEAGLSPTAAIGGILRNIDTNAYLGNGDFFVAEADESDGSFLYYRPKYSIITNIDHEHLDYYGDFEKELETFGKFLNRTKDEGCVFCCGDDANLKNLLKNYRKRYLLFGLKQGLDIYPKDIKIHGLSSEFDCIYKNKPLERFTLALGGEHNISNALSVIALGLELGVGLGTIKKALAGYQGAKRRLEIKLNGPDCMVIDDYAHHPTEIMATLDAVKRLNKDRIIAVFQPHRYSRSKLLLEEFGRSFNSADYVIITDIYPASESPIEGVTGQAVAEQVKNNSLSKKVVYLPKQEIVKHILKITKPADAVITLGAGDITKLSDELVEEYRRKNQV